MINEIIKDAQANCAECTQVLIPAIFFDAHCIEHNITPEPCAFFGPTVRFRWSNEVWAVRAAPMESQP